MESPNEAHTYVQAHLLSTIRQMPTGFCGTVVQPALQKKLYPKLSP